MHKFVLCLPGIDVNIPDVPCPSPPPPMIDLCVHHTMFDEYKKGEEFTGAHVSGVGWGVGRELTENMRRG